MTSIISYSLPRRNTHYFTLYPYELSLELHPRVLNSQNIITHAKYKYKHKIKKVAEGAETMVGERFNLLVKTNKASIQGLHALTLHSYMAILNTCAASGITSRPSSIS